MKTSLQISLAVIMVGQVLLTVSSTCLAQADPQAAAQTAAQAATPATAPAQLPRVDVRSIIASAPTAEEYPDADAIILFQRVTYRIDAEGRLSRRVHQLHKLFTEWACRNLSDLRPGWDATRQELIVHTCRTFMRDGQMIDTPPNGFNEVTPDAVVQCPDFLSYREMVISHVGVERDCIIELDYEITDTVPAVLPASGLEFMQGELPIRSKQIVVTAPQEIFLTWQAVNGELAEPLLTQQDDIQSVFWVVRDLPAIPGAGNETHRGDLLPYVMFSIILDQSTLAAHLRKLTEAAADSDTALQYWLSNAEAEAPSDADVHLTTLDTVERIATLLGDRIRTVQTSDRGWGRHPRPASRIFATSYGTAWEKAILGITLLREVGLSPELALFSRWDKYVSEVATPLSFQALRLVFPVDGDNYWLSPTSGELMPSRSDLVGKTGFFLDDSPKQFRTYLVPPFGSTRQLVVNLQPGTEGGFVAQCDLTLTGQFWFPDRETVVEDVASNLASSLLQDAEVVTTETRLQTPIKLQLRFTAEGPDLAGAARSTLADSDDKLVTLTLPLGNKSLTDLLPGDFRASQISRPTPLFLVEELQENLQLSLTLPEKWQVAYLPSSVEHNGNHASFKLETENVEGVVRLNRNLIVTGGTVTPEVYASFREVLVQATAPAWQHLILAVP
jgi:hypothetical protein